MLSDDELRRDFAAHYATFEFATTQPAITHRVYRRGDGPGVLLMHELPGLSANTIRLANRIVEDGFTVYLPLLFGEAFDYRPTRNYLAPPRCVRREFRRLAAHDSGPITTWLRALCVERIQVERPGPVGAIGMCLTGGFAIALLVDTAVTAPVTCHPALPLPPLLVVPWTTADRARALGIGDGELAQATARARDEGLAILGLRYDGDWICPAARFARLADEFGERFGARVLPGKGHSVLTADDVWTGDTPAARALAETLAFLRTALVPGAPPPAEPPA